MTRFAFVALRTEKPEECLEFYKAIGLAFRKEQHASGPVHYAAESAWGIVFELYPGKSCQTALGFFVELLPSVRKSLGKLGYQPENEDSRQDRFDALVYRDPDGRRVELRHLS